MNIFSKFLSLFKKKEEVNESPVVNSITATIAATPTVPAAPTASAPAPTYATDASGECYVIVRYYESCSLKAYADPGSKDGKPITIGWGHTGSDVKLGDVWSQDKADATLVTDGASRVAAVARLVKVGLTQSQFDALVSFVFNIGSTAFANSTMLKLINEGDFAGAKLQFTKWKYNDGVVMKGLIRRRAAEAALFGGSSAAQAIEIGKQAA